MTILNYNKIGNGEISIIVLHELMGSCENYKAIIPYLDTAKYTYYFTDLRGYGLSKKFHGEFSSKEAASDIKNLINYLNLDSVHILAHSMSTMIAQKLALIDTRIKQLILITPISASGVIMKEKAKNELISDMQKNENKIEQIVEAASKRYTKAWKDYRISMAYNSSTLEARVGYMKMYLEEDFRDEVSKIQIPINIIVGKYDFPVFSKNNVKKIFEIDYKNVNILECQEAGHYPMIECPVYFATKVEQFISKVEN